jgi:hypothetical protein
MTEIEKTEIEKLTHEINELKIVIEHLLGTQEAHMTLLHKSLVDINDTIQKEFLVHHQLKIKG